MNADADVDNAGQNQTKNTARTNALLTLTVLMWH